MKLADLTWEQAEPLIDAGMMPAVTCPRCQVLRPANIRDTQYGWVCQCIGCRQAVDVADVVLVGKSVLAALGWADAPTRIARRVLAPPAHD